MTLEFNDNGTLRAPRIGCGCSRHDFHDQCGPACKQIGCGLAVVPISEVVTRNPSHDSHACGCTMHYVHANCDATCKARHCGYPTTMAEFAGANGPANTIAPPEQTQVDGLPQAAMRRELAGWWQALSDHEVDQVIDKAIEYGSRDLIDIGMDLARCMDRKVDEQEAAELGVYFYLRGKLARWTEAVVRGQRPSDDTLVDIGVYVRMAQRIRSHGAWPGVGQ